jgi:exopolysaccharide biosynthesis polyprenyl glycosylphosphotransferase
LLQADRRPAQETTSGSLAARSHAFIRRTLAVIALDGVLLLVLLAAFKLLPGKLHLGSLGFAALLLALQLRAELRRRPRIELSALDDVSGVFHRTCVAYALASCLAMFSEFDDQATLLALAITVVPVIVAGRTASYVWERRHRRRGHRLRTLVVGGGEVARHVAFALRSSPDYGLEVVGVVDGDLESDRKRVKGLPEALEDLPATVRRHNVDSIVVAFGGRPDSEMIDVVGAILHGGTCVWMVPRFHELSGSPAEDIWGIPIVKLNSPGPAWVNWRLKRAFDIVVAAMGLLVAAPLMTLVSALILIDSGGPVFFRQKRVGMNGRQFDMLKFRTMFGCDEGVIESEWVADDARTTKMGKLLRATGLDELPQLFNVLKGEMSLVGPRPERPIFAEEFSRLYPRYAARHRVAGGITGWSQIHGLRGNTSIEHRAASDNHYIENWSFGKDIKIILRTLPSLLHVGTYRRLPGDRGPSAPRRRRARGRQSIHRLMHPRSGGSLWLARSRSSQESGPVKEQAATLDASPSDLPAAPTVTRGH